MTGPDAKATREHWDEQAATYSAAKQRNAAYYGQLKRLFDEAVPVEHRGRVLEVGCGTGEVLASLRPAEGVGIDVSSKMVDAARRRFARCDFLRFQVADAADTAALGEFDAVISSDVLEHVPDWRAVVRSMVLACRPGGLIVISTPNPRWALPLWVLEKCRLKMPEGPHLFVAGSRIAAALAEDGCDVLESSTHAMVPASLAGLGPRISHAAARMPLLRHLGVIQLVVARRGGSA